MKINSILIIIQRSNGDVFLSNPLIKILYNYYKSPKIDLLVNDDTLPIAKTIKTINQIHVFSYKKKRYSPIYQEYKIIKNIYKKYDLSISLTASDRSVMYALLSSKFSISVVEKNKKKSWWKKLLLSKYYYFDITKHIIDNNLNSAKILNIPITDISFNIASSSAAEKNVKAILYKHYIKKFIIFHPSAQYNYKIYPKNLRDELLKNLCKLNIPIIVTGGNSSIDQNISKELPTHNNIYNYIGKTTLEEFIALCGLSLCYVGMDTLNMHIAAALNKQVFTIFGPTLPQIWSPWCNSLGCATKKNTPLQKYGNITIFQADMPCVACGKAGCDNRHGKSECLDAVSPEIIFNEVRKWLNK